MTGIPDTRTLYEYDLDRTLTLVTRPDGKTVDLDYEPATGRLETVTIAAGAYAYGYHTATDPQTGEAAGQLATVTAPGGQSLAYSWDGTLPTGTTWSGPVAGSVARSFDDDFRVETESVNGSHTVTYQYDPDSLVDVVDQATGPDLALVRNAGAGFGAGLLTGTTQGSVSTTETPSAFGELASLVATESSNPLYSLDVSARDLLGRIATKTETIGAGPVTTSAYTYDAAGRLDTVTVNGTLTADYAYDANGNRTHEREDLLGPPIAVYDDQDRLLSYAGTSYTYSAAGDLETSTDATGTTTYGYDALGNLRSVDLPDGEQIEYGIDGQNRRVGKSVCPAPCTPPATPQPVLGFLYGDQLRIVAELDGSNDVVSRFVYATRPNVPDFMVKGGTTYRILSRPGGERAAGGEREHGRRRRSGSTTTPSASSRRTPTRVPAVRLRGRAHRPRHGARALRGAGLRPAGRAVDEQGSDRLRRRRLESLWLRRRRSCQRSGPNWPDSGHSREAGLSPAWPDRRRGGLGGRALDAAVGTANSLAGAAGGGNLSACRRSLGGVPCLAHMAADALNAALDLSGALGARAIASGVLPTAVAGGSAATGIAVLSAGAGGFQLGSALRSGIRAGTGVDIGTAPADALADRLGF